MNLEISENLLNELIFHLNSNFRNFYDLNSKNCTNIKITEPFKLADIDTFWTDGRNGLHDICKNIASFFDNVYWWNVGYEKFGLIRILNHNEHFYEKFKIASTNMYFILHEDRFNYFILKHSELINKIVNIQSK